jgi:hypothetical protein
MAFKTETKPTPFAGFIKSVILKTTSVVPGKSWVL